MVSVPARDLLGAARAFIRRSTGTAALVIAPLAAVQLASTARAQVIFSLPSGGSIINRSGGSSFMSITGLSGYFQSTLPVTANSRNGSLIGAGASYTLSTNSGGFFVNRALNFGTSASVPFSSGSIPVAYSFTLGTSGTITTLDWTLTLQTNSSDGTQTIASGSSVTAGTFSGTGNYTVAAGAAVTFYNLQLITSYNSGIGDTLTITMNQGTGQGISLNATPIPEPSTYASLLGLAAGVLALFRRWRRSLAVG